MRIMIPISAPSSLVAQGLACINRRKITLHTERIRNRHKHFQSRSMAVDVFPSFLPGEVVNIKDPAAREMASRIQRLPVQIIVSEQPIMSSCVMPIRQNMEAAPVVLLHGFDSSCLEWRYTYPLLEAADMEPWAIDLLGWGFNTREGVQSFSAAAKREHLYKFWRRYIKRPMVLVGPSLGAAATVDFAVFYPEAVSKLVLIDASVYPEGTGNMTKFPKFLAYAGVSLLKSIPLRLYANILAFHSISIDRIFDLMNVGRLHCLLPRWEDAAVDFMLSGGYKVAAHIKEIEKKTLVIWGEDDKIVSNEYAKRLQNDLKESKLQYISKCGHIPHVEKPDVVANMIIDFLKYGHAEELISE